MKRLMMKVNGRVQGVWYRASAQEAALKLGVTGYVRNLDDGSVEMLAQGSDSAVDAMVDWAQHGPAQAQVRDVIVSDYDGTDLYLDFEVTE